MRRDRTDKPDALKLCLSISTEMININFSYGPRGIFDVSRAYMDT